MKKHSLVLILIISNLFFLNAILFSQQKLYKQNCVEQREFYLRSLHKIAYPVLSNLSRGTLKENMPVETGSDQNRGNYTYLEAFGRLLTGMAPWLNLDHIINKKEIALQEKYIDLTVRSLKEMVDPKSPDYMNFNKGHQPLVDAAFLAHGLIRCKSKIWNNLDSVTQQRIILALQSTREIKPYNNNWLLFSAMIEIALKEFSGEWNPEPVIFAVSQFAQWYKGDGWYGDGRSFHYDYYNSFVIHPMLYESVLALDKANIKSEITKEIASKRYARYAQQLERMISPDGIYPVIGRSIAYRFGAFYGLSDASYHHILPNDVSPAQVRCALGTVIDRQLLAKNTFDKDGWLRIGFYGSQPALGERYISTGSLYLCSAIFVVLGLPESDPFWSDDNTPWTSMKIWSGQSVAADKAIE